MSEGLLALLKIMEMYIYVLNLIIFVMLGAVCLVSLLRSNLISKGESQVLLSELARKVVFMRNFFDPECNYRCFIFFV
jgi:hypothetical protein